MKNGFGAVNDKKHSHPVDTGLRLGNISPPSTAARNCDATEKGMQLKALLEVAAEI